MIRLGITSVAFVAVAYHFAAAGSPTQGGSPESPPTIAVCHPIKEGAARLKCYDSISIANLPQDGVSSSIPVAANDKVIARWSGSGDMTTRPFHVDGPWELQWDTAKGYFSATLHRKTGQEIATLANGMEAGSSSSYQPSGGDFYIEFGGMQTWNAKVVAVPTGPTTETSPDDQEPLLDVSGDQTGLPACNGDDAAISIKRIVEHSPMGQTMHLSVIHVGKIAIRQIRDGMSICTAPLKTNGGEMSYEFQYYREDGDIYIYGKPVAE